MDFMCDLEPFSKIWSHISIFNQGMQAGMRLVTVFVAYYVKCSYHVIRQYSRSNLLILLMRI